MPTDREREYYRLGFADGLRGLKGPDYANVKAPSENKPKRRKLSAWNKFVKANSNKKIYKFANGKLKLKKMGIAFRKTRAGKKK